MKKIFLTAIATLFFLASFAQSQFSGIVLYVTDSAAYTSSTTIVNAHATGKADIFWNAQATTPHFDWWNGSAYVHGFGIGSGGSFWPLAGTGTATGNITIEGDDNELHIHNFQSVDFESNGGGQSAFYLDSTMVQFFNPFASVDLTNNGFELVIQAGSDFRIGGNPGTSGYVLKSNGANNPPVWGADSGTGSVNTFAKNAQSGNYTLQQSDTVRTILMSSVSDQTLTIPTGMKGGSIFMVLQDSTNTVTLDASAVTVDENTSGTLTLTKGFISTIYYKNSTRVVISKNSAAAGGGHIIQDEGTSVTARDTLDFAGSGVTLTDVSGRTLVTIPGVIGSQDLFISAPAMWARVTSGCSPLTTTEVATSLFNIQSLDFDQTVDEFAQFQVALPRNWNNGTITATVYWTATAGTGTVQWEINAGAYSNDDPLTTALGTAIPIDDTLIATNDVHISPTSSAITIAGTPADADFLAIQIMRDVSDDTLSADAKLLGVRITITLDAATSE